MNYYINKIIDVEFDKALVRANDALGEQGFGILTEIDVKDTLKKKLNVEFRKYVILGTCNPQFAYEALKKEDKIGVMLPCSVIVQDTGGGKVEVAAIDPVIAMQSVDKPALAQIAYKVRELLAAAIKAL